VRSGLSNLASLEEGNSEVTLVWRYARRVRKVAIAQTREAGCRENIGGRCADAVMEQGAYLTAL